MRSAAGNAGGERSAKEDIALFVLVGASVWDRNVIGACAGRGWYETRVGG